MSELFHTILLRVTLAGVASAVALRVVEGGALREIVKLAAGLLMLLALLQPLAGLRLTGWDDGAKCADDHEHDRSQHCGRARKQRAGEGVRLFNTCDNEK